MSDLEDAVREAEELDKLMKGIPFGGMAQKKETFPERVCPYCGYRWTPRVPNPVSCPGCKKHFHEEDSFPSVPAQMFPEEVPRENR